MVYILLVSNFTCGLVSYHFHENTERQMCEEEGGVGSGEANDAAEKRRCSSLECPEAWGLLKLPFSADQ